MTTIHAAKTTAKAKASAWRSAKRAGYQINKTDDGWRWSKNFCDYSDGHRLRADAIEEAIEHYKNNCEE